MKGDHAVETTRRRKAIMDCVLRFEKENGFWPSVAEISRETGIPDASARRHISMLIAEERLAHAVGNRGISVGIFR